MICFTSDTPLRRVEHLTKLLEEVFEHIHSIELSPPDESKIDDFEERFMEIQKPSNGVGSSRKLPDADVDKTLGIEKII